jgi:hypothetical protein
MSEHVRFPICIYTYTFEPAFVTGSRSYENLRSAFSWVLTFKSVNRFSLWESGWEPVWHLRTPYFHRHHHDVPIGSRDDLMMFPLVHMMISWCSHWFTWWSHDVPIGSHDDLMMFWCCSYLVHMMFTWCFDDDVVPIVVSRCIIICSPVAGRVPIPLVHKYDEWMIIFNCSMHTHMLEILIMQHVCNVWK